MKRSLVQIGLDLFIKENILPIHTKLVVDGDVYKKWREKDTDGKRVLLRMIDNAS